jgi:hypothetical protein
MLCTPWMLNLGCKSWFAKKKVYCVDECTTLLYANSTMDKRFNQLSWWLLVVHHKYCSRTRLRFEQLKFMIKNNMLKKALIPKNMIKKNLVIFSPIIILLQGMKWTIFDEWSTTTKMESNESKGERSMMKSMEIKDHGDGGLKKPMWSIMKIICMCTNITIQQTPSHML